MEFMYCWCNSLLLPCQTIEWGLVSNIKPFAVIDAFVVPIGLMPFSCHMFSWILSTFENSF